MAVPALSPAEVQEIVDERRRRFVSSFRPAFRQGRPAHHRRFVRLFRRQDVIEAGGLGEDMEPCVRLHRRFRERKQPYRVVFLPDPVCWTEVPESRRILGSQRNRWQRGLFQVLGYYRAMILTALRDRRSAGHAVLRAVRGARPDDPSRTWWRLKGTYDFLRAGRLRRDDAQGIRAPASK